MKNINTGEKIAKLEVGMEVLKSDINEIKSDLKDIKIHLQLVEGHDLRIRRIERDSSLWKWLSPSLAAVAGSVLTFLIVHYLNTI